MFYLIIFLFYLVYHAPNAYAEKSYRYLRKWSDYIIHF